jgi:YesN/AraC family two-component response regulator
MNHGLKTASEAAVRHKVLVVEDDPEINQAYRKNLSYHFHVIAVRSGAGAIGIAKAMNSIELVLLDYMLPDMSGMDVLKEIKKALPAVPVILVTGHGTEELAVRFFRCGVTDYIKKPFNYDHLISRINLLVSSGAPPGDDGTTPEFIGPAGCADAQSPAFSPQHLVNIRKVIRYIDDNYMTGIDLEEAARIACMSPCHFSRVFKKAHGTGFKEYLHRKRIEKAMELLHNPALSVAEIAFAVGYGDLTQFERIFKKATRSTPSAYRNTLSKDSSS